MDKTEGTITEDFGDYKVEKTLFTYNENEMQENKINKNNANLILKPKYVSTDVVGLRGLGLNSNDKLIYGFIEFFLEYNELFYCTNEQLSELFEISENTVGNSISRLEGAGLIKTHGKIKAGGGKIRFISLTHKNCVSTTHKNCVSETQKLGNIYNKVIDNNIIEKESEKNFGATELIERLKNYQLSPDIINLIHEFDKCKKGQKISKMDDTQLKRWVNKLKKLGLDNYEGMKRVIENSIVNGWQGIFELKGEDKKIAESSKEPKTDMDYIELYHKYYLEYKEKELKEKWGDDKYYEIRRKWLEWCASK